MKNASALVIANCIKHCLFIFIKISYKIFFIALTLKITLHVSKIFIVACIFTIFMFFPQYLAVIGKRFIQGKIATAFTGYKVSKPLVKQFMCDRSFPAIAINQLACVLLCAFLMKSGS